MATPRGRKPLGTLKQPSVNTVPTPQQAATPPLVALPRRLHRFGDSINGVDPKAIITGFKPEDSPTGESPYGLPKLSTSQKSPNLIRGLTVGTPTKTTPLATPFSRPGRPTPGSASASDGSSPFHSVKSDEYKSAKGSAMGTPLRMPINPTLSYDGTPKNKGKMVENKRVFSAGMRRPSVDNRDNVSYATGMSRPDFSSSIGRPSVDYMKNNSYVGRPSIDSRENKTVEWAPWGYRKGSESGSATPPVIPKRPRDNSQGERYPKLSSGGGRKTKPKLSPLIPIAIPKPSRIPFSRLPSGGGRLPSSSLPSSNRQHLPASSSGASFTQRAVRRASELSSSWNLPVLPTRRRNRAGSNASSSIVASSSVVGSSPSVQRMSAISTGTSRREPSFSSDNLDDAEVIDPSDSVSQYSNHTIRQNDSQPRTHTTQARTKAHHTNTIKSIMDQKKAAASASNKRLSMGGSFLSHNATTRAEASKQAMTPNNEKPQLKAKSSVMDQPTQSTRAKQCKSPHKLLFAKRSANHLIVMPQLSTSNRKYNPRASMGNLAGNLRAPASLATVAMSNVNARGSVRAMEMETEEFYEKLWPGIGLTPDDNKDGSLFHEARPDARVKGYLREKFLTAKEAFLQEFGQDKGAKFADFITAWDMVETKHGKPKWELEAEERYNQNPTLPAPSTRVPHQTGPDAEKKTHTQNIVSGFKKSISKTGLSNLAKVPSMMALSSHNNFNGRSTSGPAYFESSKPSRPLPEDEIFAFNPDFPDDDLRCVRQAMSQVYWAGRFSSANTRRMNEPEGFAASIAEAVRLSKKADGQGDANKKIFQDLWDQKWDEKEVGRALDVFNELNQWCKTVEARRSLREYRIHVARTEGWHVLLPAGIPMKEPPASGMARMAGKMMGRGEMSIREMQLQFRETREANKAAGVLQKKSTKGQFKPRRSILGLHENGIPGYESGMPAVMQQSYIPVLKGIRASPRVHTPTNVYSSSPVQTVQSKSSSTQHGSGGTTGRTWYGRKKPALDDTPRPMAMAAAQAAANAANAASAASNERLKENANPSLPTLTQAPPKPMTREEKKREKNQQQARKEFDERLELSLEVGAAVAPTGVWRSRQQEETFGLDRR